MLGLSASLLCFSLCMHFCRYIIGTDKHFENYDRIAEIVYQRPNGELYLFSPLEGKLITEAPMNTLENRCMVISIAQINHHYVDEKSGKQVPVDLKGVETDGTFDRVFGVKVVAGSWQQASNMPNSIVLSESKAQKLFGSAADAVGRPIYTSERYKTVYTVRAVMADMPQNISFFEMGIDMLKLNDENSPRNMEYGYNWHAYIYGLMPDGVELEDVNRELTNSVQERITHIVGQERTDETIVATHMGEQAADNVSMLTSILTTFAILILSVGLLNFLHFLVGSIVNRTREYSLRRMFGCRLRNLFGMLFTQTFLLLAATALVCAYATKALIPLIEMPAMFADFLCIDTTLMWWQTAEYIGWLLILCAAICIGVSIFIQRIRIQQGMTGMSNAPRIRRHAGRNLMMGLQFFICWIFVSLTVAFYLQARLSTSTVLGSLSRTEKEQILSIPINSKKTLMRPDEKMALVKRLKAHAGVKDVMTADGEMLGSISGDGILTERGNMDTKIDVLIDNFPTNYFSFMNLEVVSGVLPKTQGQIAADTDFAALFDEDILGRVFYEPYSGKPYTVTAIVRSTPRTVGTKGWISHNKYGWLYMCEREWAA
ncbi:MAG: ABC transporter permease, partial [Bacteroidaceae bacterium]|nr:ABC transporter permease [Bacteroidaceae bacterium]